ncbi:E3 ubiquitin-protein ligase ATL6 [Bienertia sinuspersici]
MAIIFLFTGCLAVFLRRFSDGCFGLHVIPINPETTSDGQLATKGLDDDVINSIPTYVYADVKQHRKGQVELECAVCLNEFQDPEALRLLPGCSHVFHPRCIDRWLTAHVTCPICRQSLEPPPPLTKQPPPDSTIINIDPTTPQHDHHDEMIRDDHNGVKKMIVGKFPRSHSTGHSIKRHTLVLPEDVLVQSNLSNRTKWGTGMNSPRSGYKCGWFSMTPPIIINSRSRTLASSGLIKSSSSKNLTISQVKTTSSDHFRPI